ncbi:MAG TPA: transcription antitermination factor NusB [Phycisphaerae bacterium]|nr:transcription antitermination factor NusB [Phycisphaerae bacterium]
MRGAEPNARDLSVLALRDREGNVSAHLASRLAQAGLSRVDAALARELALGSARRRATLEAVLRAYLVRPDRHPPGVLREILLVALYQVLFLQRVPDFAAVNEAVEQAARFRHRRQSGLVNGVLRTVARGVSEEQAGPVPTAREVVPCGAERYRTLDRPVFPDPRAEPAAYLASAYSLPAELAERWLARFGSLEKAIAIATHADARAPLVLRVRGGTEDVESVLAELSSAGVAARRHVNGQSIVLDDWCDVTSLAPFKRGVVQPQDPTATAVVVLAQPKPGMSVLDFCAAPGTKTTHLAERMRNEGSIVALDVSQEKLERIEANCRRMSANIVSTRMAGQAGRLEAGSFDLVLADVPCTNTGVLARRAEARWRFSRDSLSAAVRDQKLLIRAAGQFVRRGGRLVYSTCSLEPEEGPEIARWYQKYEMRMQLKREELTLPDGAGDPTRWRDGGYTAVFEAE